MAFPARKQMEPFVGPDAFTSQAEHGESLTCMWVDYYSKIAQGFEDAIKSTSGPGFVQAASDLLLRVSQESSLHLLWDYMNSPKWKPQRSKAPEDDVNALLQYLASLRWEKVEIASFVPGQELILEVEDKSQANCTGSGMCKMTGGAAAAIMDLLYGEGSTPEDRLFSFRCTELPNGTKGDSPCRFVVHRNPNHTNTQCVKLDFNKR